MPKVLHIIPTLNRGGAERIATELALNHKKWTPEVLCLYPSSDTLFEQQLVEAGVPLHFLDKKLGMDFSLAFKVHNIIKNVKPDVIQTHLSVDKYVFLGAKIEGVKGYFHTVHSIAEKDGISLDRFILKLLYRNAQIMPVGISEAVAESIRLLYSLPKQMVPVVYNGIDVCKFALPPVTHENFRFIQVGSLTHVKNPETTVLAFNKVLSLFPDTQLWFVGDGPEKDKVIELVDSLGISDHVHLYGLVDDVGLYTSQCDAILMPSRWEGFGLTLVEGMAAGLAAITSDGAIFKELAQNGANILLSPADDIDKMAESMITLLSNRKKCAEIRAANREHAKQYSVQAMVNQYEALYDRQIRDKERL